MRNEPATTFKQQMEAFHKKMLNNGKTLTQWTCPHCQKPNDTVQPKPGDVSSKGYWDSLKRCYECDESSFVSVYPSGITSVQAFGVPVHVH